MSALNPVPEDPSLSHDQLHKLSENLKLQNRQRKRNRNLSSSSSCGGSLHSDAAVMSAQSLKDAAARMKPEEEIYVNLKELVHPEPGGAGESGVRNRQQEPETRTPLKVAAVVLALLSLVLLVLVVWVSVVYNRDFSQLSGELTNQTAEKDQLQSRNQNLTEEVAHLESRNQNLTEEMDRLESRINRLENGVICPHGWRRFGCSCYWFSTSCRDWQNSRQNCLNQQADLVIINGREEMEFLNKLGVGLKFWIGLRKNSMGWTWTNDRSPSPDFWQSGHPVWRTQWNQWNQRYQASLQDCGAFNSFQTGSFYYPIKSWSSELCSACLQSVCEKEAVPSGLL
uniref:C-type lectin domain-containing protein n=1 Tax=Oryzias latipes TaxID=8090 RepID=A0A3P9ILU4_ORYLA